MSSLVLSYFIIAKYVFCGKTTFNILEPSSGGSGIKLNNISRKNRFIDNKFVYALITLGYLCHPQEDLVPTKDDVRAFISMVLDVDPIRSSVLADIVCAQNPFAEFPEVTKWDIVHRIGYKNNSFVNKQ